jgi:hypothetical protein
MIGEHENTSRRLRVHGVPRNRWAIVAAIVHRAAEPPAENKPARVTAAINGSKSRPYTISVGKKLKSIVLSNVSAPPIESTPTGIFVMCRRWGRSAPASGPSSPATEATGGRYGSSPLRYPADFWIRAPRPGRRPCARLRPRL